MKGYMPCRYCDPFGDNNMYSPGCPTRAATTKQETTPTVPTPALALTDDSAARKDTPLARGVLDYFPAALAYVAQVSAYGNAKHNPESEELIWTRGKSNDHADCILRHLADRGLEDGDGIRHSGYVAWRALALLQEELEAEGAAPGRAAVMPTDEPKPYRVDCGGGVLTTEMVLDAPHGATFTNYHVEPLITCGVGTATCPVRGGCATPCQESM